MIGDEGSATGRKGETSVSSDVSLSDAIIAFAQSYPDIRAGIARLSDVLAAPSYRVLQDSDRTESLWASSEMTDVQWPPGVRFVLVLGLIHPENDPSLDWWERGNTPGNRRLVKVSKIVTHWLGRVHGLKAQPLPYQVERGGVFLKDAAVLAGLGVIGKNNLLLHPEWGPRIRLRCMLVEGNLTPTGPVGGFEPCKACDASCLKACPREAFASGTYQRQRCMAQMAADEADPVDTRGNARRKIRYCRACELACPVGIRRLSAADRRLWKKRSTAAAMNPARGFGKRQAGD